MKRTHFLAISLAFASFGGAVTPAVARSIVCESDGRATQYCSADTRGGVTCRPVQPRQLPPGQFLGL